MDNRWLKFKLIGQDRLLERMMLAQNLKAYRSHGNIRRKNRYQAERPASAKTLGQACVVCETKNKKQGS